LVEVHRAYRRNSITEREFNLKNVGDGRVTGILPEKLVQHTSNFCHKISSSASFTKRCYQKLVPKIAYKKNILSIGNTINQTAQ
jgi:hypothetical protein